ncbi:hypothetical protein B0O99DRAFT_195834 [Bisporella sp. PMI_857]|nr:hypothetical protein B0O99DRAFT_195834 [Bisporella sp. PMI_857]
MKAAILLSATVLAFLTGKATAVYGQLYYGPLECAGEGGCYEPLYVKDYNTGSIYNCGRGYGSGCTATSKCDSCWQQGTGGYNFGIKTWRTANCFHIDFLGALDSGDEWCCGANGGPAYLPCDIKKR